MMWVQFVAAYLALYIIVVWLYPGDPDNPA